MARRFAHILIAGGIALGAFLIYRTLSRYDAAELVAAVGSIPPARLLAAGAFAAGSYLCLSCFDFLALHYAGRPLPYPKAALASFTALSIGNNIGFATLSGGAIRFRFYRRWGLGIEEISKLILFCAATVGLGIASLTGIAMLARPDLVADLARTDRGAVAAFGAACLAFPLFYLCLAAFLRRPLRIRGVSLAMPRLPLALAQVLVGTANFACIAACLHQLVRAFADTDYLSAAAAYAAASITSRVSHVPGGLGVIETVVPLLLPGADLIGALIAFRFAYYFVPLAFGLVSFTASEALLRPRTGKALAAERAT